MATGFEPDEEITFGAKSPTPEPRVKVTVKSDKVDLIQEVLWLKYLISVFLHSFSYFHQAGFPCVLSCRGVHLIFHVWITYCIFALGYTVMHGELLHQSADDT